MALGPGLDYARSWPDGCLVNSARALPKIDRSRIPGRPITLDVALGSALRGLAGLVMVVLIAVRPPSTHRCPPGQLAVPALPHHPADPGPDQHADQGADPGHGADPGPLGARDGQAQAA